MPLGPASVPRLIQLLLNIAMDGYLTQDTCLIMSENYMYVNIIITSKYVTEDSFFKFFILILAYTTLFLRHANHLVELYTHFEAEFVFLEIVSLMRSS